MIVTQVLPAIAVRWMDNIGGDEDVYYIDEPIIVVTKRGNKILGILKGFNASEDDLMQDVITVEDQDGELRNIGVNSIVRIERCGNGTGKH